MSVLTANAPSRSVVAGPIRCEGLVRIFRVSRDGSELTLGYVKPNEICGELSVFSGLPRESYAIAILPSQVCEMPQATFERMMRERGDHLCHHEPFGEAWYFGEDRLCPRPTKEPMRAGLTFASVWEGLKADAARKRVFIKDFPHYIMHTADEEFLSAYTHSFLIRTPEKMLPSMYKHWPDFGVAETGYADRVEVRVGDGYAGWPEHAPFDAVVVTAAPPRIPEPLKQQLRVGGRLVIPVGRGFQQLLRITRTETGFSEENVLPVRFVPMTGRAQND